MARDLEQLLNAAIEKRAKELPPNSLQLPKDSQTGEAPAIVSAAGPEFVDAWKLYRRVTVLRSQQPSPRDGGRDQINAATEREKFDDLLQRTIEADPPPDVSEYDRFTYSDGSFCANGQMRFAALHRKGRALTMLRNGKTLDALNLLLPIEFLRRPTSKDSAELLLPAFGADAETFRLGEWLAKKSSPDRICKTGGEKTARMILSWIDLHFDAESKRRTTNVFRYSLDEPYFPRIEISQLLRPESGVTDETKSRIVDYIQTKGILLTSLDNWLRQLPEGAEKWIVPVARLGLDDPLNRVRKRSAAILATAGVEYTPPTLRPNPRFRILVNGENWPGRLNIDTHLSLSIRANTAGFAGDLEDSRDGIVTCDADCFFESGDVTSAEIYDYPYIRGQIPLPVNFEKIGTVNIVTRKLIISPIFPDLATSPEDRTYAVELDPFEEGHKPDGRSHCRIVKNHEPCIYPNVTPGEYWLRVRSAGAELEDRQRLTIGNNDEVIRPRLKKGSSLVVPLEWPEGFDPKTLPPELGSDWPESLGEIVKIMGVTSRMDQESIPIPEAAEGRFPNSMIFPYLPPGKYTVEAPARTVEPSGVDPGCVIQPSSIAAEVREDSPIFVITAPLKILYRKKEKAL